MNVTADSHRRIGVGERFYDGDIYKKIDGTYHPISKNLPGSGVIVTEDDMVEFYRPLDIDEEPLEGLEFTITAESKPMRMLNVPDEPAPVVPMAPKARTNDEGKAPLAHVPWESVRAMSMVQAYGHVKYQDFNNYRKGMEVSRNVSCALRHITAWMDGEDRDPESGLSHLAHAMTRLGFVIQNIKDGVAIDDRYKSP